MMPRLLLQLCLSYLLLSNSLCSYATTINIGVQSPRSPAKTLIQWGALGKYLENQLDRKVNIVPLKPDETTQAVKSKQISYMLSNPALSVELEADYGAIPLLTLIRHSGIYLAGVIISKKGSGITKAEHLIGKKVMGFKFKRSAGAYMFQVKHLLDKGIDPHKDFSEFYQARAQDDIVFAVRAGIFDAGFIMSGLLERMRKDGIYTSEFNIVDQKKSDQLSRLHSTQLYPQWSFTASKHTSAKERQKVNQALLALDATSPASIVAGIKGFTHIVPLEDLRNTLKALKLAPYNKQQPSLSAN